MNSSSIPNPREPVVDQNGMISPSWYRFLAQFHISFLGSGTAAGTGLEIEGNELSVADDGITNAMLRRSIALSIIGRPLNTDGNPQDIQAMADGQALQRDGTAVVFRYPRLPQFTVAALPSASGQGAGTKAFATDATATTFASVVAGGGANGVPVYSDGTNWRIG